MVLKGIDRRLGAIADLKLGKNVGHMGLDRLERDEEFICDPLIFITLGDELKHISFTRSQVLLVGGGIGVPPLLEVAKELHARGVTVVTVLGFATKDAVILETELARYGQVFVTTDDGSYGIKGNVSVVINDLDSQFDAVYSCGAPGMMKYINQTFYDHPRAYLSLESRMACGMGACYACVLKVPDSETVSQRVCEDGPVFRTGTVVL